MWDRANQRARDNSGKLKASIQQVEKVLSLDRTGVPSVAPAGTSDGVATAVVLAILIDSYLSRLVALLSEAVQGRLGSLHV